MRHLLIASVLSLALGCAKKPAETPAPEPEPAPAPAPAPEPEPAPAPKVEMFGPTVDAVHYETGGTAIAADQMKAVQAAADVLKGGDWNCIVVGLADATGDADVNKELSQKRAETVAAELLKLSGVDAGRVVARGIGEKLATGAAQSERKVEFVFYKDAAGMSPKEIVMKSGVLEADFRAKKSAE